MDKNWSIKYPNQDLILLINLVHLVSHHEAEFIISSISNALNHGGRSIIYGPFQRNGSLTSNGDKIFHQDLIRADPEIGYKDDTWMLSTFIKYNLKLIEIVNMPANNLAFITEKI